MMTVTDETMTREEEVMDLVAPGRDGPLLAPAALDAAMAQVDADGLGLARGYTWEPFRAGNLAGKRHGAESPRFVQPIADTLTAELIAEAPWCASPAFKGAVASWSWAEGQAVLLRRYLDGAAGWFDEDGNERPANKMLDRVEARLLKLRDGLGLNPVALARLMAASASVAAATARLRHLGRTAAPPTRPRLRGGRGHRPDQRPQRGRGGTR
jgi:hypothetical protein